MGDTHTTDRERNVAEEFRYTDLITAVFTAITIASGVTAGKIFSVGGVTLAGSAVIFPLAYIFGDILTEVYGFRRSRRVIWIGLFCSISASAIFGIVAALPPDASFDANEAYLRVLGQVPRIAVAGWLAYFVGEMSNSVILSLMKIATKGKHLWSRTIASTLVGELLDTFAFFYLAFWGVLPGDLLVHTAVNLYLWKVGIEVIFTPVTYLVVGFLKRKEGVDVYDHGERYNPFRFDV